MKVTAGANSNLDVPEFIHQLRRQETAAFTRLVQSQQLALKRFIRSIADNQLTDDILQETWISAYRGLPNYEGRAALKIWLFTIARHEASKQYRKKNAFSTNLVDQPEATDNSDQWLDQQFDLEGKWLDRQLWDIDTPEALLQAENLRECIDNTMQGLKPDQRTVLNLRELEQMSMEDISAITGFRIAYVRVLLHRARLQLLQTIQHYLQTGECPVSLSPSPMESLQ